MNTVRFILPSDKDEDACRQRTPVINSRDGKSGDCREADSKVRARSICSVWIEFARWSILVVLAAAFSFALWWWLLLCLFLFFGWHSHGCRRLVDSVVASVDMRIDASLHRHRSHMVSISFMASHRSQHAQQDRVWLLAEHHA
jgi:hypothetical protein